VGESRNFPQDSGLIAGDRTASRDTVFAFELRGYGDQSSTFNACST
jgi:hypothetical protein